MLKDSEWDHNASGIVTNSQNNDDAPSPQDGACPNGGTGPTGTYSCTIIVHNYVHDNNNNKTPLTTPSPFGTGIVSRGRPQRHRGGQQGHPPRGVGHPRRRLPRLRSAAADRPLRGRHHERVRAGHAASTTTSATRSSTTSSRRTASTATRRTATSPSCSARGADAEQQLLVRQQAPGRKRSHAPTPRICRPFTARRSAGSPKPRRTAAPLLGQAGCDTRVLACDPSMHYPTHGRVVIHKLPPQPSMPNPCAGVPANPWCPSNASGHRRR